MTNDEFNRLRGKGYSIEFVDSPADISACVCPSPAPFGGIGIALVPALGFGKRIKVRYVPFGGDVMLYLSPSPFICDFTACPSPLMVSGLAWLAAAMRR